MGVCYLHQPPEAVPDVELLDHLRVLHPDVWGDGPQRWPDGRVVVFDATLEPGDFSGGNRRPCGTFHVPDSAGVCTRCGWSVYGA